MADSAVHAELLAMVRGDDDNRVVADPNLLQLGKELSDHGIGVEDLTGVRVQLVQVQFLD